MDPNETPKEAGETENATVEYNIGGEMLTEVEVSDEPPEDDESIWTDDGEGDDMEENMEEAGNRSISS
jgi:hypothetical protein